MTRPLRAQLDSLTSHHLDGVAAATFDTRAHGPRFLTGAASRGIARRLEQKGAKLVLEPESFLVDGKEGPLAEGESSAPAAGPGTSSPNWLAACVLRYPSASAMRRAISAPRSPTPRRPNTTHERQAGAGPCR